MKKILFSMLSVIALFTVITLTSCGGEDLKGTWSSKNSSMKKYFGENAESFKDNGSSSVWIIDDKNITMKNSVKGELSEEEIAFRLDVEVEQKYSYVREGDMLKLTYVSHNITVNDIEYDEETQAMIDEQGIDMKANVKAEMEKDPSIKQPVSGVIKTLDATTLVIEDETGQLEFIRK